MKRHYIIVILGKFASGKTTIAKLLQDRYGFKRAITCTTRRLREGERDGVDYYFYDDSTFEEQAKGNKLVAINRVPVVVSGVDEAAMDSYRAKIINVFKRDRNIKYSKKYGLPIDKIDLENNSYICVLEPSGYFDLVDKLGKEKVKAIYLNINDKERMFRALNREVNPDVDSIVAKYLEEKELYNNFEDVCDKVIDNAGTSDSAAIEIHQYISKLI